MRACRRAPAWGPCVPAPRPHLAGAAVQAPDNGLRTPPRSLGLPATPSAAAGPRPGVHACPLLWPCLARGTDARFRFRSRSVSSSSSSELPSRAAGVLGRVWLTVVGLPGHGSWVRIGSRFARFSPGALGCCACWSASQRQLLAHALVAFWVVSFVLLPQQCLWQGHRQRRFPARLWSGTPPC
jgi:hypothetical protein